MRALTLTDYQLKSCNKWQLPGGLTKLAVPHTLPFFVSVGPNTNDVLNDQELSTPADHDFICKVVSCTNIAPNTAVQIQWPDGRYLSNPGLDFFSFVGTGRRGRLISPHKFCPKASKIKLNFVNTGANAEMEIYFEGVILVDLIP
jgi:hypothetical protein